MGGGRWRSNVIVPATKCNPRGPVLLLSSLQAKAHTRRIECPFCCTSCNVYCQLQNASLKPLRFLCAWCAQVRRSNKYIAISWNMQLHPRNCKNCTVLVLCLPAKNTGLATLSMMGNNECYGTDLKNANAAKKLLIHGRSFRKAIY